MKILILFFLDSRHGDVNLNACISLSYNNFSIYKAPLDKLKNKHRSFIDFAFKGGKKNFVKLLTNGTTFWDKKTKRTLRYTGRSLKTAVNHLFENCYLKWKT